MKIKSHINKIKLSLLCAALCTIVLNQTPVTYADSRQGSDVQPTTATTPATKVVSLDDTKDADGLPMTNHPESDWPSIISKSAVVIDMSTGTVVYSKAPLAPHYPASITKILTALIALQKGSPTDQLVTSKLATQQDGNRVYLVQGEVEPLQKLLYGLLLNSGNDAAVVIAEHYGGSVNGFAGMMNQTAESLGATHSHFTNPNGLPDKNHVTTAYDMALISRAAMQIPEFRTVVSTRVYNWQGQSWQAPLVNLNHMLFNYPGCIGIKTGYTLVANETLVVAATHGNTTFLAVLMDAPLDAEIRSDATQLLNFAFSHYYTESIYSPGQVLGTYKDGLGHSVRIQSTDAVMATEPIGETVVPNVTIKPYRPNTDVSAGTNISTVTASLPATNAQPVNVPAQLADTYELSQSQNRWSFTRIGLIASSSVLALFILGLATYLVRQLRMRANNRRALP